MELILCHRDLAITFEALVLFQPASPDTERLLRETSRVLAEASPDKPFEMGGNNYRWLGKPLKHTANRSHPIDVEESIARQRQSPGLCSARLEPGPRRVPDRFQIDHT